MAIRQVLRRFRRAPGFMLVVLLLVAGAVAVNATAFGALWSLGYKAMPYRDGGRLLELRVDLTDIDFQVGLSQSLYESVRARSETFAGAVGTAASALLQYDEHARPWRVRRVTPDFARVLGVAPALGRSLVADDAVAGADAVLVLSDRAWRAHFGAARDVLGQSLRLKGREFRVVGVMPPAFAWPDAGADAWMPYVATAQEREHDAMGAFAEFEVAARLADGANLAQARAALAGVFGASRSPMLRESPAVEPDVRAWRERYAAPHWRALTLLQLAGALLLLVAMANLANLVLDRLLARRHEFAIRRALGASEPDVLRAVLVDLLPPALAGVALGCALVPAGVALLRLRGLLPAELPWAVGTDAATLAVGLAAAVLACGGALLAALLSLRRDRAVAVSAERVSASGMGRPRAAMLVAQVALTTALVGGAGLLLRSAANLMAEERGFDANGVLMTRVDLGALQGDAVAGAARRIEAGIAALPGVERVASADMAPFGDSEFIANVRVPGTDATLKVRSPSVGPGYFAAMGIALRSGREFAPADADAVVVDERFAQRWLRDPDPTRAIVRIATDDAGGTRAARVIGVARAVKQRALDEGAGDPVLYQPLAEPPSVFYLVTRTGGDPAALAEPVRARILALAPDALLAFNRPLDEIVAQTLVGRRALLEGVALYALATLLLAALGLHAVLGALVRRRTAELGVRMALGASAGRIRRLVLAQGGVLIGAGLLLGLGCGLALALPLADRLHRLAPTDPLTWLASMVLVAAVALGACALPAWRASRIAPRVALSGDDALRP